MLLLAQEGRNERNSVGINLDASLPSINLTTQEQLKRGNSSNSTDDRNNWNPNRGRGVNRFNRGRNWNNNSKPQCQLCGKFEHTALRCYSRFDRAFQGPNSSSNVPFNRQSNASFVPGHNLPQHHQTPTNAFMVSPDLNKDMNWYPDSGASNHVSNDFNNMSIGAYYFSANRVHVGNETSLDVLHIGSSFLPISFFNLFYIFLLKNLHSCSSNYKESY